jgi:UDP-N-acetylmuramate: L-alanyl-gamma-D-glutamyl-meso-diaminopimelate ligase
MRKQKWFHAIGICGKTTANVAKMFKEMGWFVTGSDAQFMPPAVNILDDNKINYVQDYHYSHLTKEFWEERLREKRLETGDWRLDIPESPDLGLIMSFLSSSNKEFRYAKLKGINIKPYAQVLREYLVKENSIVVVGTAGKTTTTALTTLLLQKIDLDPSYMIAADVVDISDSIKNTNSTWSVLEGDEYHSSDPEVEAHAKFLEYKPKYVILTNIGWEHPDIYPTQESYNDEFRKLVKLVPEDGLIIAKADDKNIDEVIVDAKCEVIRYKAVISQNSKIKSQKSDDYWSVHKESDCNVIYSEAGEKIFEFNTKLIGDYNLENILACLILVHKLFPEVDKSIISSVIESFNGVRKRLEKLYESEGLTIIDDFGVTPPRAKNSLGTIRENYPEHKIIAVFEPYGGGRPLDEKVFLEMYNEVFDNADEVIVPELSSFKEEFVGTDEFVKRLQNLNENTKHIPSEELLEVLSEKFQNNKNYKLLIVFFSSYRLDDIAHKLAKKFS